MSNLLEELNPSQREAVTHTIGPLLIIAGPGSGKTRTVVHSIAYAIEKGEDPSKIAAFTFTRKAARELKKRVGEIVAKDITNDVQISTFHSFCGSVVQADFDSLRIDDEQEFTVKELTHIYGERKRSEIDYIQHHNFPESDNILRFIMLCKAKDIDYSAAGSDAKEYVPDPQMLDVYVDLYKKYEQLEDDDNPYTRVQLLTYALFRDVPEVKAKWQEKFSLIFVDEYQDTDPIQYRIIKALAEKHQNLRVVGDDDQGIYGWRGADIQNILNFEKDYPNAKVISLGQNYRSTQRIVAVSRALAEFNPDRREKELFTRNFEGDKVTHLHCENDEKEAFIIGSFIRRAINQGGRQPSDFAVLYRINKQEHVFKTAFNNLGIQFHVVRDSSDMNPPGVSIMTIHKSKGLEFPNVFVTGISKDLLPHYYNRDEKDWPEELRLLYVAMSRAKNWLCLSSYEAEAESQRERGQSPFLERDYIPASLLESVETLESVLIPPSPPEMIVPVAGEASENVEPLPEKLLGPDMTVLGIDPGIQNVGWSITQKSPTGYTVLRYGTQTTTRWQDTLVQTENKINELLALHRPDAIAVEKLEGAKEEWFRYVAGCVATIRSIADQHGIECHLYTPQHVKYVATDNRNASKLDVQRGVMRICSLQQIPEPHHSADAIAASLCYLRSYLNSSRFEGNARKQEYHNLGLVHLNNLKYNEAIAEFKKAINIDPIDAEIHCGLGRACLGQGDLEAAENAAKTAIRLAEDNHPDSQKLLDAIKRYRLGCNAVDNKQFDKATTEFQESINLEPFFIDAYSRLSRAYLRLGNLETAKNIVEEALKLADNYPPIQQLSNAIRLYNAGLNFLNDRRYSDAIDKFQEAIDRESTFTEARYWLGYAHFQNGALEAAEQSANDTLELTTDHQPARSLLDEIKNAYVDKGYEALERLDLTEAEKYKNKALQIDEYYQPAHKLFESIKKAHYKQACDYLNDKQYSRAISEFNKLINKDPNFIEAYCELGRLHFEKGELDAAKKSANMALQLDENYPSACTLLDNIKKAYVKKGCDAFNRNNLIAAEKFAKEAYSLDKNYQSTRKLLNDIKQVYYKQGLAHIEVSEYAKAINPLLKASDIDPDDKEVWTNLGRAYYWIDEYDNAANCYRKAADIDPNDKTVYINLGNAYYWIGAYDKAINPFQKARDLDLNCAKTLFYLARAYFGLGSLEKTKQTIEKALDISPTYPPVLELLEKVRQTSVALADEIELGTLDAAIVLIPASEFQMGNSKRPIRLDNFYIDKYPVTNAQYKKFLEANPQWRKDQIRREYHDSSYLKHWDRDIYPKGKDSHPVVYVSWYAAKAYAKWVDKRLPTEAEWEKAARGGLVGKIYPWGNSIDPSKANYDKHVTGTSGVGSYTPNKYGLYDMVGNVWEWCLDEHDLDVSSLRVLRGGSWTSNARSLHVAGRASFFPIHTNDSTGFRCAKSVTP